MAELEGKYQRTCSGSLGFCAVDIVAYGWQALRGDARGDAAVMLKGHIEYSMCRIIPIGLRPLSSSDDASFVFSLSRLNCRQDIAIINNRFARYHSSNVGCLPADDFKSCEQHSRMVTYPSWAAGSTNTSLSDEAVTPSRSEWEIDDYARLVHERLLTPVLNRAALPYPPSPVAFLLATACTDNNGDTFCLASTKGAQVDAEVPTVTFEPCPSVFRVGDKALLPFLWTVWPAG